jgi:hypothetical protein
MGINPFFFLFFLVRSFNRGGGRQNGCQRLTFREKKNIYIRIYWNARTVFLFLRKENAMFIQLYCFLFQTFQKEEKRKIDC